MLQSVRQDVIDQQRNIGMEETPKVVDAIPCYYAHPFL
jgi:hypothetical protein